MGFNPAGDDRSARNVPGFRPFPRAVSAGVRLGRFSVRGGVR
jgi:hypothetical protein